MAPPGLLPIAVLLANVLAPTASEADGPLVAIAPPSLPWFIWHVQPSIVSVPPLRIAPPSRPPKLPERVLPLIASEPRLSMAPPSPADAELFASVLFVIVAAAPLRLLMAPATPPGALLLDTVEFLMNRLPPLSIAPPGVALPPVRLRLSSSRMTPLPTWKRRVAPPPSSVILPPPSMIVSCAIAFWAVNVIVAGAAPQSNTTLPPPVSAVTRAASVQLPAEPVPTVPAAPAGPAAASAAASASARPPVRTTRTRIPEGRGPAQPSRGPWPSVLMRCYLTDP